MKYTQDNCMEEVLKVVPCFRESWQEHLDCWDGKSAGLILDMIELAAYTNQLFLRNEADELKNLFSLVETMQNEGTQDVKDAIATGFLESIVNPVTKDTAYLPLLVSLLGEKSRAYCKEWLKLSGEELPGI